MQLLHRGTIRVTRDSDLVRLDGWEFDGPLYTEEYVTACYWVEFWRLMFADGARTTVVDGQARVGWFA